MDSGPIPSTSWPNLDLYSRCILLDQLAFLFSFFFHSLRRRLVGWVVSCFSHFSAQFEVERETEESRKKTLLFCLGPKQLGRKRALIIPPSKRLQLDYRFQLWAAGGRRPNGFLVLLSLFLFWVIFKPPQKIYRIQKCWLSRWLNRSQELPFSESAIILIIG